MATHDKLSLLKRKIRAEASRELPGSATIGRVTCSAEWNSDTGAYSVLVPIVYTWKVDDVAVKPKTITEEMFA